jgi:hypothetical protein
MVETVRPFKSMGSWFYFWLEWVGSALEGCYSNDAGKLTMTSRYRVASISCNSQIFRDILNCYALTSIQVSIVVMQIQNLVQLSNYICMYKSRKITKRMRGHHKAGFTGQEPRCSTLLMLDLVFAMHNQPPPGPPPP